MKQAEVIMLGESLRKQGGIVSVQTLILDNIPAQIQMTHQATLVDGSGWQKAFAFFSTVLSLIGKLATAKVDLLHIHVSERGSAFRQAVTTLVGLLFDTPVIMHAHGPEFHLFYAQLPKPVQAGLSWIFRRCAHFIVLSESWRTFYVQTLKLKAEQVTVLPNAVKLPPQVALRQGANPLQFVFFGRIGQRKGAFDLVKAFAQLSPAQRQRAHLILAGDGEVEELRQQVRDLDLEDQASVLGWVSPEQRDQLLQQADAFVLPSYNEALPMSLLEAMGWGLPVITTPVGGIPELIQSDQNGLLVPPGDIQQLADALALLIENHDLRIALGDAARTTVLPFDIKPYCNALVDIYCSVLSQSRSQKEVNHEDSRI
jgi:glycosyltransferase involved in cell wall biosynthesis